MAYLAEVNTSIFDKMHKLTGEIDQEVEVINNYAKKNNYTLERYYWDPLNEFEKYRLKPQTQRICCLLNQDDFEIVEDVTKKVNKKIHQYNLLEVELFKDSNTYIHTSTLPNGLELTKYTPIAAIENNGVMEYVDPNLSVVSESEFRSIFRPLETKLDINLKIKDELENISSDSINFGDLMWIQSDILVNNDISFITEFYEVGSADFKELLSDMIYNETFSYFLEEIKDYEPTTQYVKIENGLENVTLEQIKEYFIKILDEIIEDQEKDYFDEVTR